MSIMKLPPFLSQINLSKAARLSQKLLRNNVQNLVQINRSSSANPASVKQKSASSVYRSMNIFDRRAKALQRERAALSDDYHLAEYVKEEIGWRTADRVFDIKRTFTNAVELGACRGYVSRHFLPDSVEKVTLCDTSQSHLDKALVGDGVKAERVVMDEEAIDFPENSVDLVVSSLVLHWVNDLPGVFDKVMKCLKPDGVFMSCLYGSDTLIELRQSLQLAESERLGGVSPHISPFTRIRDIGGLLTAAGYTLQTVDVDTLTVWYPTAWEVMRDVKALGDSNAALNRPVRLNKDVQFAAAALYEEMYGKDESRAEAARRSPLRIARLTHPDEGQQICPKLVDYKECPERKTRGVPATYQIINFVGWKPDPSQPQPIERGSGKLSLKDLKDIDEIITDKKKLDLDDFENKF